MQLTQVNAQSLKIDHSKPTILIVGDSPAIHTGFAQVIRSLFRNLHARNKWNLIQLGLWHANPEEETPWPVVSTERDPKDPNRIGIADRDGSKSFDRLVDIVRPDLVWVLNDAWNLEPVLSSKRRRSFTCMVYVPVDGSPLSTMWDGLKRADIIVPFVPWAEGLLKEKFGDIVARPIPHGVNTTLYHPTDDATRRYIKRTLFGVGEDDFVCMTVSRNQARKNIPALIELLYYIRSGEYGICPRCRKVLRTPYDYTFRVLKNTITKCPTCRCTLDDGTPHPDFYLYLHTSESDLSGHSWHLPDLYNAFRMGIPTREGHNRYPGVLVNRDLQIAHGIPESDMASLLAAADGFTVATTGEGFGLPKIEAMACGTPVVAPDISSHPDFVRGAGELVPIAYHVCEITSGYYRGYPDLNAYLTKMIRLLEDPKHRAKVGQACFTRAQDYSWDGICDAWDSLFDKTLSSTPKRWKRLVTL